MWALLCELVHRLAITGYHHTLEVELRFIDAETNPEVYDYTMFLPEFREKGIVTVIDVVRGNRVLYSSTHDR